MNLLVVHGPNLNLLGEARATKRPPRSTSPQRAASAAFARALGVDGEDRPVEPRGRDRRRAPVRPPLGRDAIIINPAALTHTSYACASALFASWASPTHRGTPRPSARRETWRRKSVIKDVCAAQVMGKGLAQLPQRPGAARDRQARGRAPGPVAGRRRRERRRSPPPEALLAAGAHPDHQDDSAAPPSRARSRRGCPRRPPTRPRRASPRPSAEPPRGIAPPPGDERAKPRAAHPLGGAQ